MPPAPSNPQRAAIYGEQGIVVRFRTEDRLSPSARSHPHAGDFGRARKHPVNRVGQRRGIARIDQHAGDAILDCFRDSADARANDRPPNSVWLENRKAKYPLARPKGQPRKCSGDTNRAWRRIPETR